LATPKSRSFAVPRVVRKMFAGLAWRLAVGTQAGVPVASRFSGGKLREELLERQRLGAL
jgi:hypothetical protein